MTDFFRFFRKVRVSVLKFHGPRYQKLLIICTVKPLNSGHLWVLKNLNVIERCSLLGGNLKKIVTSGTKRFVRYSAIQTFCPAIPLFKTCPLFGMSAFGRFHCITDLIN